MSYGYGYGYGNQVGPASCGRVGGARYGSGFALIVVLFILLIIIGASFVKGDDC